MHCDRLRLAAIVAAPGLMSTVIEPPSGGPPVFNGHASEPTHLPGREEAGQGARKGTNPGSQEAHTPKDQGVSRQNSEVIADAT